MTTKAEKVAVFRFGVIAPLVCRLFENEQQKRQVRREILEKLWKHPDGGLKRVSERALRYWLSRYRQHGLDGLYDSLRKARASKGVCRALSPKLLEAAADLRKELPSRSVRSLIKLLGQRGFDIAGISERTLSRQLKERGVTRQRLERGEGYFQRWEQVRANDLWQGDTAHGVWLPDPNDPKKVKRTKLIAFIDDATRVCTHAEFYFDERLPSLIDTFSKALLKRGRPCRLLLDNAFIYHSNTLEGMCSELQVELSFCRPRRPQGKGKIERWILSTKTGFYGEAARAGLTTLEDLNRYFQAWLAKEYHERVHSELNMTPLERWQMDAHIIRSVSPEEIRRALMLRARRRVHENTCTVSLEGEEYQTSPPYAGQMVEVRWHPDNFEEIEIWHEGCFVEIAQRVTRSIHVDVKMRVNTEEPSYPPLTSSKQYLGSLDAQRIEEAPGIARIGELLTCDEFIQLVAVALKKQLQPAENDRLRLFFVRFAPIKRSLAEAALVQAVDVKGTKLHLRYYLQHLEQVIQSGRRK
jgi:transposase InsO family protein